MNKNKILFWAIWLFFLALVPWTILQTTSFSSALKHPLNLMNFIQRFLGLTAYTLMFTQIILGAYMTKLTEKLGGWIYKFHVWEGIGIYSIILMHPTFFVLVNYFAGKGIDPFYVFTQICLICQTQQELYYTLGRISFWLLNVTVLMGLFRTATPFMRMHWKKFHVLNFLVFLLIGIHGLSIGTDFMQMPFFAFAIISYGIILGIVTFKELPKLYRFLASWFNNRY